MDVFISCKNNHEELRSQIRHLQILLINSIYILVLISCLMSDVFDYTKAHKTVMAQVKAVCSFLFNILVFVFDVRLCACMWNFLKH